MMDKDYVVGIDLGTSNTVCAVWKQGEGWPQIIPISQPQEGFAVGDIRADASHPHLPSAVGVFTDEGAERCYVGRAVKKFARFGSVPGRGRLASMLSIKRHMGTEGPFNEFDWTPEFVSGCILRAVHDELVRSFGGVTPRQVVITVPASFSTEARTATMTAAQLAGFDREKVRLIDEPIAALLSELKGALPGLLNRDRPAGSKCRVMVVDIGGGTLDVAVVDLGRPPNKGLEVDVIGRSQKTDLAGDDFDLGIAALLLERFSLDRGCDFDLLTEVQQVNLCADLMAQAEAAKISILTHLPPHEFWETHAVTVELLCTPDGVPWRTEVSAADVLGTLYRFLGQAGDGDAFTFGRALDDAIQSVLQTLEMPSRDLARLPRTISEVWLTGGSARIPLLPQAVASWFGICSKGEMPMLPPPVRLLASPDFGVALGAAVHAGSLVSGFRVSDLSPVIKERMYDGVYIETHSGQLARLVSPSQPIPMPRTRCRDVLKATTKDPRLELCLYLGAREDDPLMSPLLHRTVDLNMVLSEGDTIRVFIEINANREVRPTLVPCKNGVDQPEVVVQAPYWRAANEMNTRLPQVNGAPRIES